jgi:hypothetical protein
MRKKISIGLISIGLLLAIGLASTEDPQGTGAFSLVAPVFAQSGDASFLDSEAGISAYANIGQVDLTRVKSVFRTVEKETDNYVVGSVELQGLSTVYDVHVYVQKDGWIVAYYIKDDPASKILATKYYADTGDKNNLKDAINLVSGAVGAAPGDITYYDFRSPAANKMIKITGGSFRFNVPGTFTVSEASFATGCYASVYRGNNYYDYYTIRFNGKAYPLPKEYQKINILDLIYDDFNTVSCYSGSQKTGIVLIYREP